MHDPTRRNFVAGSALLAGAALTAGARAVLAQAAVRRVGLLSPGPPMPDASPPVAALIRGLARRGYVLGRNLAFERRGAQGDLARLPQLVGELIASRVEAIVTFGFPPALAAKEHSTVPVVVTRSGDPVATGLVESLSRPGGNVTGVTEVATELSAKRLELIKEAVPTVTRVALLWNLDDLAMTLRTRAGEVAARDLGLAVQPLGVRAPNDFDDAFSAMTREPPDAILLVTDVLTMLNRQRVYDYALAHRLPAMYEYENFAHDGGLMSYGADEDEVNDRAAGLVDRIFRGTRPADLPLERPTRFRFVINMTTARALGLTIPQSALFRADELIE